MHKELITIALTGFMVMPGAGLSAQAAEETVQGQDKAQTTEPVKQETDLQQQRDEEVAVPTGTVDEAIAKVKQEGLMTGDPKGRFHPERSLTRAELASILVKTFDLHERKDVEPEPISLKDVPNHYWAAKDIKTVAHLGVMSGYRDGFFYPEQRVSRAEAMAIFAQAYGIQQLNDSTVQSILSRYPDATQIPEWARKAMATSLKNGFVDVPPSGKIRPQQMMTRGSMAFALNQYLKRLNKSRHGIAPQPTH